MILSKITQLLMVTKKMFEHFRYFKNNWGLYFIGPVGPEGQQGLVGPEGTFICDTNFLKKFRSVLFVYDVFVFFSQVHLDHKDRLEVLDLKDQWGSQDLKDREVYLTFSILIFFMLHFFFNFRSTVRLFWCYSYHSAMLSENLLCKSCWDF